MYLRAGIDSLPRMNNARTALPGFAIAIAVLIAGLLLALTVGRYPISLGDLIAVLVAKMGGPRGDISPAVESVIWQVRGPRVMAAMLVGAALAVAGTAFQGLFRNPLVSPDILGASSGAALGAVLGIYLSLGVFAIQAIAFVGGLIAVGIVYVIGASVRSRDPILVLVLTGVVVGSLFGAGVGLVKYLADPYNQLPAMTFWLLGSLSATGVHDLLPLLGPVAIGAAVLIALRWRMNVMSLPEEEARALGVATGPLRIAIVAAATLVTSASVATAGIIGWVGLVVPHLARSLVGPDFARLLPASAILGGGYLLLIDTLARTLGAGRNSARHFDRRDRHAILHLAARQRAEELVMILEGHQLTIGYPDRIVGSGLDVRLQKGEVLALLGPNGGGKTTLLKTLLGLLPPKAGEVRLDGAALSARSIRERARLIAYVPQTHVATFAFTVRSGGADGPHRAWRPVRAADGEGPRGRSPHARPLRHRAIGATALHHDFRRRAPACAAGARTGAGAAIHRAGRADRQSRLRQPGQGDARDPRAGGFRPRRSLHHP